MSYNFFGWGKVIWVLVCSLTAFKVTVVLLVDTGLLELVCTVDANSKEITKAIITTDALFPSAKD